MKKNYRFVKKGVVSNGLYSFNVKLLIQLSQKNLDKYRIILKLDDSIKTGWEIRKFSTENNPEINGNNIYFMEDFFQNLIISLYRKQYNIDLIEEYKKSRGENVVPLQWKFDRIREDWLQIW